uniref:Uncharacterized protein n=1 Tax=Haptolina ericina TaxID=156174 RepID=A0A7S3C233_9EUKA
MSMRHGCGYASKHLMKRIAHAHGTSLSHGNAHRFPKKHMREVDLHRGPPFNTGGFDVRDAPPWQRTHVSLSPLHTHACCSMRMQKHKLDCVQPDLMQSANVKSNAQVVMVHIAAPHIYCCPVAGSATKP